MIVSATPGHKQYGNRTPCGAIRTAFVFPVALLCDVAGFALGQRIFTGDHLQVALSHPGAAQAAITVHRSAGLLTPNAATASSARRPPSPSPQH